MGLGNNEEHDSWYSVRHVGTQFLLLYRLMQLTMNDDRKLKRNKRLGEVWS